MVKIELEKEKIVVLRDKIKNFLSNDKYKKIIILAGLLGIALIFASSLFKPDVKSVQELPTVQVDTETYARRLEDNLKNIVCTISGAGEAKVLVTLESSLQTVYATEQKKNNEATEDKSDGETSKKRESNDLETKYIKIKDENGAEKALSVTQLQPTVKGVVVVCKGGDDPDVQKKIADAVKTALNITSKRVFVTK
ncbi:MAG: stage III sporulation protein AG [Eubacteriales bacterium SKADARSKE-1]|nr:stage III sporulation protein AG [Eubacteriales bacterium SKADARSKE-1]